MDENEFKRGREWPTEKILHYSVLGMSRFFVDLGSFIVVRLNNDSEVLT